MGSLGAIAFFMNSGGRTTVPSGVIAMWAGTNATIPTGWSRVTTLDGRYVKQVPNNSTNPGSTGGSSSHNHPYGSHSDHGFNAHSHTWPNSGGITGGSGAANVGSPLNVQGGHTHSISQSSTSTPTQGVGGPANYDAATVESLYLTVIFIQSDGTPVGIPNNALAYFNATAPTGWAQYTTGNSRLIKGAATGGDGGATGGTGNSHTHTSAVHTHLMGTHTHGLSAAATSTSVASTGPGSSYASGGHTHAGTGDADAGQTSDAASESTNNGDMTPPWIKSLLIQNTSGVASLPSSIICLWTGTIASIPVKWKLCDGTGGTPNLSQSLYTMASDTSGNIGTTGGTTTHTHTGSGHSHTFGTTHTHPNESIGGNSGSISLQVISDITVANDGHGHNSGGASGAASSALGSRTTNATANTSNDPVYTTIAYIQYTG